MPGAGWLFKFCLLYTLVSSTLYILRALTASQRVLTIKLLVFISSSSLLVLTSPLSEMLQLFDLCYTPPNWQFHYKQKVFYADQGVITSKIREEES